MELHPDKKIPDVNKEINIYKVISEHGDMITKEMAVNMDSEGEAPGKPKRKISVKLMREGSLNDGDIVDVEDYVYRIFNRTTFRKGNEERSRRTVVLGDESESATLVLWDKQAEIVDSLSIERGDKVLVSNLRVKKREDGIELSSLGNTYFARVAPSSTGIVDFSTLKGSERNIDIIGRIVSVGQIRYFNDLVGKQSGVSDCTITDNKAELRVAMWRSSSIYASVMHPGDCIKIEYASTKEANGAIEISAGDSSRILISRGLASRIRKI